MVHEKRVQILRAFTSDKIIPKTSKKLKGRLVSVDRKQKAAKLLTFLDELFGESAGKNRDLIAYIEEERIIGVVAFYRHDVACPVLEAENWLVDNSSKFLGKLQKFLIFNFFSKKVFLEVASVKIAIDRIWVHSAARRQGIATELIEAIRKSQNLTPDDICFTDPTEDGAALGKNYFKKFLVAHV